MTSKEAFNEIKQHLHGQYMDNECLYDFKEDLDIIEKDLEESQIADMFIQELIDFFGITNLDDLKDKICKESIVLEIIKNKRVNIELLFDCNNLYDYNMKVSCVLNALTETEFNLIKEWLDN